MKLNFLNLQVILSRDELSVSKHKKQEVRQECVDAINNDVIQKVLENGEDFYKNKLLDITLDLFDKNLLSEAIDRIEKDGIFVIPNYLEVSSVDKLCKTIDSLSAEYLLKLGDDEVYEDNLAIVQRGLLVKKGYRELADSTKPVFNIRSGSDDGMIDIFNVDQLIESDVEAEILTKLRKDNFLKSFLDSLPKQLTIGNINSYVNKGVTQTRGFHVDSYNKQIKIFIYLTDVLYLGNGPYTFVKGTHSDSSYRHINQSLNKDSGSYTRMTETPIVPFENVYPVLATKGSLVVSDQAGFHRGFPQSQEGTRRVLTINCM